MQFILIDEFLINLGYTQGYTDYHINLFKDRLGLFVVAPQL